MSQKSIREYDGKRMISRWLQANASPSSNLKATESRFVQVTPNTSFDKLAAENPWLLTEKLVVKPDQLIKRRGKGGLILLNADWEAVKSWIADRMEKEINIEGVRGVLNTFIVEPFCPHDTENDEYYFCIRSVREGDELLFYYKGGIEVGNVDEKADKMLIEIGDLPTADQFLEKLPSLREKVPQQRSQLLASFFEHMFKFYSSLYYAYFEINPVVVVQDRVVPLDLAAKIDSTADFEQGPKEWWGNISFPPPFGRPLLPEEQYIQELDSKTGASLKLTILNMKGRIWTMVAGGGASVVYADTISDLGFGHELANYGEYSGDPSESLTYEYAKTIIGLMTREKDERGKILIIGGGIANFTNVAETFKGIIRALTEFKHQLIETGVKIYVRRGGPNYQQGLKMMKHLGKELGIPIQVYGPETHITYIVSIALGMAPPEATTQPPLHADWPHRIQAVDTPKDSNSSSSSSNPRAFVPNDNEQQDGSGQQQQQGQNQNHAHYPGGEDGPDKRGAARPWYELFYSGTRSIVYGMQERAVQGMLDFDHLCGRKVPSVAAMIYPFAGNHFHKFYWGGSEMLLPVFSSLSEAVKKFPEVDTIINFASFRSVYQSTMEALQFTDQIRTIAIIAEGVPENRTKMLIKKAKQHNVTIIGPATVGGIKPGCFRIGNTGGMLDNILSSKLYRPGNVAFVSRSGGMSNELNNIISRNSNGTYEGIAIGGDRYPGTTFIDHMLRFQEDPEVKMLVLLGEVGGIEEYEIVKALKSGKINKPLVAWCVGTCAKMFPYEVQFGHAGALAHGQSETAGAKNEALREAGAVVPKSFNEFGQAIRQVYTDLVERGIIVEKPEPEPPTIPMDYSWAQKLGLIRKPASFVSSVSDERGEELLYAGMPISAVFKEDIGVGGVLSLLWFRRLLPKYACKFIEMILQLVADHGPAVAGAHNTIVTARAGKDLVSSLVAGLLTVGPRFGGAVDEAAQQFTEAYDANLSPQEFVDSMRKKNKLISGIGHKIKSLQNPDMRVTILKDFVFANFNNYELLKFALEVEKVTTAKKANLILNVDGCIGVAFVDLMRSCGAFTREEVDEYIKVGCLNGLFVLGRSIGLIGHYMDQKLLKQGLYRHPWDDISYVVPQKEQRPDGW